MTVRFIKAVSGNFDGRPMSFEQDRQYDLAEGLAVRLCAKGFCEAVETRAAPETTAAPRPGKVRR